MVRITPFNAYKARFIAVFDEAIVRLSNEFPNVKFGRCVEEYQVYLSALILDAAIDAPDLVELVIGIAASDDGKTSLEADLIWGHPSGNVESSFAPGPVDANEENLQKLYLDLPRLLDGLRSAVMRARPKSTN